jgi:hypothetical protein
VPKDWKISLKEFDSLWRNRYGKFKKDADVKWIRNDFEFFQIRPD